MANTYVWPLSGTVRPDPMNTSFGPRINRNRWDFHDGIDLPAALGTPVHAMSAGTVVLAGPGGTDGFSSRHIVLEVNDPRAGPVFLVYVHLDSIGDKVTVGASVKQRQVIGTVGEDDATYPHLHIEFRKGSRKEEDSVHPLGFLPYRQTWNFTDPRKDRFSLVGDNMAARLLFRAPNKNEGDFRSAVVEFFRGSRLLSSRTVDVNDKNTVNEGNADENAFKNDIAVEGYQKSDMVAHNRHDLHYGVLVRNIPPNADRIVARVSDVAGRVVAGAPILIPRLAFTDDKVDFEDNRLPPSGWTVSSSDVSLDAVAANTGALGLRCIVPAPPDANPRHAGIEFLLPVSRFEWSAEGSFRIEDAKLLSGQVLHLLRFGNGDSLSVAAGVISIRGELFACISVTTLQATTKTVDSSAKIVTGQWRRWRLDAFRLGTRESTAVLRVDDVVELRINWDSRVLEPEVIRAGIASLSPGATAEVFADDLRVTEAL